MKEPQGITATDGRRSDLLIILQGKSAFLDVRVTHSLCPSHRNVAARYSLGATKTAEREKERLYEEEAKNKCQILCRL